MFNQVADHPMAQSKWHIKLAIKEEHKQRYNNRKENHWSMAYYLQGTVLMYFKALHFNLILTLWNR